MKPPAPTLLLLLLAACGDGGPVVDADGDGWFTPDDCDDADPAVHPEATDGCDGVDADCDGVVDENPDLLWYPDADGDGFGEAAESPERLCAAPTASATNDADCDDRHADVFPGADEVCDGRDNDCDGATDEGIDGGDWYRDADGDGLGDPAVATGACVPGDGWVTNAADCDDTNPADPLWVSARDGRRGGAGTATDPMAAIQEALDVDRTGCVYVAPGTYEENLDFHGREQVVIGIEGPSQTVVRGFDGPVVRFDSGEGPGAALAGFTLTGGTGECTTWVDQDETGGPIDVEGCSGGGIHVGDGNPTLLDLVIVDNTLPDYEVTTTNIRYGVGGGLYLAKGEVLGVRLTFTGNSAWTGGGVYVDGKGSLQLLQTAIGDNAAVYGAALTNFGDPLVLQNVIVSKNDSRGVEQAVLVAAGHVDLANVTVVGNDTGIGCTEGASVRIYNGIFAYNDAGIRDGAVPCDWTVLYTDFWSNTRGDHAGIAVDDATVLAADPRFVGWFGDAAWEDDDLHLLPTSPAVDAGYPDAVWNDADGSRGDLGAFGGPNGAWP